MSKKITSSDLRSSNISGSSWAKDLLSGKAGKAANQSAEKNHLYDYFKKSLKESGGSTTMAIAKTMGYLKRDSEFSGSEIMQIKSGLKEKGYFVPGYSIGPEQKRAGDDVAKELQARRDRIEKIAARGKEVKQEVKSETRKYFSSSKAEKRSVASSFFSSRPRF
jgi:hypothetical protein